MERLDPRFKSLLGGFDIDALEREAGVIFGLFSDLTFGYFNPAWARFAAENRGRDLLSNIPLGCSLPESIHGPLRDYYAEQYSRALNSDEAWEHEYQCSSPQTYRLIRLRAYPLARGAGLLAVNTVVESRPIADQPEPAQPEQYRDENGLIVQCCHCRRVRRRGSLHEWDWVAECVERPQPRTSHGLCRVCFEYYYPSQGGSRPPRRQ